MASKYTSALVAFSGNGPVVDIAFTFCVLDSPRNPVSFRLLLECFNDVCSGTWNIDTQQTRRTPKNPRVNYCDEKVKITRGSSQQCEVHQHVCVGLPDPKGGSLTAAINNT